MMITLVQKKLLVSKRNLCNYIPFPKRPAHRELEAFRQMKATAHKKPSDGSLKAALLNITSRASRGRWRNTFHNSPRQPGPSPSPSEPAMRAEGRRWQPPLLPPGPARHGVLPSPCRPRGQPARLRPGPRPPPIPFCQGGCRPREYEHVSPLAAPSPAYSRWARSAILQDQGEK